MSDFRPGRQLGTSHTCLQEESQELRETEYLALCLHPLHLNLPQKRISMGRHGLDHQSRPARGQHEATALPGETSTSQLNF